MDLDSFESVVCQQSVE